MIHFLRAMMLFAKHTPLPRPDEVEWTQDNQLAWFGFLKTETGRKLLDKMRSNEHTCNVQAVTRSHDREYACGYAAGFRACMAWQISLSADRPPQESEQISEEPLTGAALTERLSPS